jgi:O-antigen ligase
MPPVEHDLAPAKSLASPTATSRTASPRTGNSLPTRVALAVLRCLPVVFVLAAIVALSFLSGGYIFSLTATVVFVGVPLTAVWVWLVPRRLSLGGPVFVALVAFAAFTAWAGLSIAWSVGPDLSWLAFDVCLLYLIVAVVVTVTPAGPAQLRLAGYGFVAAMVPVAVYAFLGKVLPDVVTHAHLYPRLSAPLGYWNVLAMMMVMAVVPALEGASRRSLPVVARGACAAALALFAFTLFFSFSRGGTLALALALAVYFVLTNERLQGALSLALTAVPVAAVLYHGRHLGTLFNFTSSDVLRTAQGHLFGRWALAAICLALVAQVAVALVGRRISLEGRARQVVGVATLAVAVVVVATGGLAFASRYGGVAGMAHKVAHQFTSSDTSANPHTSGAGRLLALGSNGRIPMAREGLKGFRDHPLAGSGAGTFRFTNYLYRPSASFVVKHAHNQWINVLSELGIVGFVLFVLAIGGLLVAALRPVGRAARDADRGLLAALQAVSVAFVFHMTIDWDWDMAAAAISFLLLTGVAAAYVRRRRADARRGSAQTVSGAESSVLLEEPAASGAEPAALRDAPAALHAEPAAFDDRPDALDTEPAAPDAEPAAFDDRPDAPDDEPAAPDAEPAAPDDEPAASRGASRAPRGLRFGVASRILVTGVLLLVALSWLSPYLSQRALSRAILLASESRTSAAVVQAHRAHRFDPLAVDPLFTLALVEQQQGRGAAAQATLEQAVRLQPQNYATYYELGLMQLNVLGLSHQAAASFKRALSLNPYDENSSYERSAALAPAAAP